MVPGYVIENLWKRFGRGVEEECISIGKGFIFRKLPELPGSYERKQNIYQKSPSHCAWNSDVKRLPQ